MNDLTRNWLRRIALGLPLTALPLQACSSTYGCDPPRHEVTFDLASVPRVGDGGIDCISACDTLATGVDAGVPLEFPASCREGVDGAGAPVLICDYYQYLCEGRRPQSLLAAAPFSAPTPAAAWLAQAAHLEAASIPAFFELAVELELHGAPSGLAREARRGGEDEIWHARVVASLARRHGATPPAVRRAPAAARDLRSLAFDNAVEGCAREAFGALAAEHQARAATDERVAHAFRAIARDEARHALFSFALHDWVEGRLSRRDRRAAEEARRATLDALAAELAAEPEPELRRGLGLPEATRAVEMVRALA